MKSITRKLLAVMMAAMMLCLMLPISAVSAADNLLVNGDFSLADGDLPEERLSLTLRTDNAR